MVDKIEVFISYAQEDEETIPFRGQTERLLKKHHPFVLHETTRNGA